jgi:hypothetical protein
MHRTFAQESFGEAATAKYVHFSLKPRTVNTPPAAQAKPKRERALQEKIRHVEHFVPFGKCFIKMSVLGYLASTRPCV